jgi:hypothetical protein
MAFAPADEALIDGALSRLGPWEHPNVVNKLITNAQQAIARMDMVENLSSREFCTKIPNRSVT